MKTCSVRQTIESRGKRLRIAIGRDRLEHERNTSTAISTLTTVQMQLNSTMFTKEARYMIVDIKDFNVGALMQEFEFGYLTIELFPGYIIEQRNLNKLASKDKVHFEIQKRMPGLK